MKFGITEELKNKELRRVVEEILLTFEPKHVAINSIFRSRVSFIGE